MTMACFASVWRASLSLAENYGYYLIYEYLDTVRAQKVKMIEAIRSCERIGTAAYTKPS